jgi:Zn-dependent M28 family amino/carboxypeptidase
MNRRTGGSRRRRLSRFLPVIGLAVAGAWAAGCGDDAAAPTDPGGDPGGDPPVVPFEGTAATITAADVEALIADLADDSTAGRGSPSPELDEVAAWLAARFEAYGLAPAGEEGYLQWFEVADPVGLDNVPVPNVVARLEGSDPVLRDQHIVLTAHFDHLGLAPDGSGVDVVYNGADDNASGTAALLEIAEALGAMPVAPKRSIVLLAVSAEEKGLLGSRHWMDHPTVPLQGIVANLNFDMVGRNQPGEVDLIRPVASALAAVALAVATAHPELDLALNDSPSDSFIQRSDSGAFVLYGIESLFYHSGLHADYHTVEDEARWIDTEKVAKVAKLGYWTAVELAGRP